MLTKLQLLDTLADQKLLDLDAIESWQIGRLRDHFIAKPIGLKIDESKSLRSIVGNLIESVFARRSERLDSIEVGAVMLHLVGAKLEILAPTSKIKHSEFSPADPSPDQQANFLIGDTAIHVTTAPTEALIRKCSRNLSMNLRPIIITTDSGVDGARALARNVEIGDRIEIFEIEQFVATNVYEWCGFEQNRRPVSVSKLVEKYNAIIDACETDPSLKISMG